MGTYRIVSHSIATLLWLPFFFFYIVFLYSNFLFEQVRICEAMLTHVHLFPQSVCHVFFLNQFGYSPEFDHVERREHSVVQCL